MEKERIKKVGQQISDYADALSALEILDKQQALKAISIKRANKIIKFHNMKENPSTYLEFIRDFANAPKDGVAFCSDEPFTVEIGTEVYQAKVVVKKNEDNTEEKEVHIQKKVEQQSDGTFALLSIDKPIVVVKFGPEQRGKAPDFEVFIEKRSIFKHGTPRPNDLQREVIGAFGKELLNGKNAQLAIMGTGTGKSFVLAGITHSTDAGVFVVPNAGLAKEMEETIELLHGKQTRSKVKKSNEFKTPDDFERALKSHEHIILLADDPDFAAKAKLIEDKVVVIDESHQHVYDPARAVTLQMLKNKNVLLAVTGTPSKALREVMGQPMVDVNVRTAIDKGYVRQVDLLERRVPIDDFMEELINDYFVREVYCQTGIGVISVEGTNGLKEKIKAGMSEDDAIDLAIKVNCERSIMQKNFFFSGNIEREFQVMNAYEKICSGTYEHQAALQKVIARKRLENEIAERARLIKVLHPNETDDVVYIKALEQVARKNKITVDQEGFSSERYASILEQAVLAKVLPVDLATETKDAQCKQIATTMNALALAILFGGRYTDYEKKQRVGEMEKYLEHLDYTTLREKDYSYVSKKIDDFMSKKFQDLLPASVRQEYHEKIKALTMELFSHIKFHGSLKVGDLCHAKDIDLKKLEAHYTRVVNKHGVMDDHKMAILDALRAGLVMHAASDVSYATGYSIQSVMHLQHFIDEGDPLISGELVAQLQARNIRDNDRCALNSQIVNDRVPENIYFHLQSVFALNSGELMMEYDAPKPKDVFTQNEPSSPIERSLRAQSAGFHDADYIPLKPKTTRDSVYDLSGQTIYEIEEDEQQQIPTEDLQVSVRDDSPSEAYARVTSTIEEVLEGPESHKHANESQSPIDRSTQEDDELPALEKVAQRDLMDELKAQGDKEAALITRLKSEEHLDSSQSLVDTKPVVDVKQESSPVTSKTLSHKGLEPTEQNAHVAGTQKSGEKDKKKGQPAAAYSFMPESNTKHNKHRTQNFFKHEKLSPEQQHTYKANLHDYSKKGSGHRFLSGGRKEWHEHGPARGSHSHGKQPKR